MRHLLSRRRLPLLAALLAAGCATVGPDYRAPTPALPATWQQGAADAGLARGARADISQWWQQLGDAELAALVNEALVASPDMRSAQARLREARARRALAGAEHFPTVTASGSASRSRGSEETGSGVSRSLYSAGFDASWEPDVFGGLRRAEEAAEADLGAAAADLQDTRVTLAAEVALNYVEYRLNQQRLAVARESHALQQETAQIAEWRELAGLTTVLDVEQARTSSEQARAAIPSIEISLAEAEHRLAILLGRAPGSLQARLAHSGELPPLPASVAIGIPADTVRQRPDIRAAERQLAAATARIGQAEAARYPVFALRGSLGVEALTVGSLAGVSALASSLAGSVAQTVFDAGRLRQQVAIQNQVAAQALANYEQTVLAALGEVEDALAGYANNRSRADALQQAGQSAGSAAELARQRYQSGLSDYQAVLETERSRVSVADSLALTRAAQVSSLIRLYKALGGGWREEAEAAPMTTTERSHAHE